MRWKARLRSRLSRGGVAVDLVGVETIYRDAAEMTVGADGGLILLDRGGMVLRHFPPGTWSNARRVDLVR